MASENKLRVFLDTNVIFSAFYSSNGAPGRILELFLDGKIEVVISQQVLEELVRTMSIKLPQALPALRTLLTSVPPQIENNPPAEQVEQLVKKLDFADAIILAAAINAKIDYFITGDGHFLNSPGFSGKSEIKIVSPTEFVRLAGFNRDKKAQ